MQKLCFFLSKHAGGQAARLPEKKGRHCGGQWETFPKHLDLWRIHWSAGAGGESWKKGLWAGRRAEPGCRKNRGERRAPRSEGRRATELCKPGGGAGSWLLLGGHRRSGLTLPPAPDSAKRRCNSDSSPPPPTTRPVPPPRPGRTGCPGRQSARFHSTLSKAEWIFPGRSLEREFSADRTPQPCWGGGIFPANVQSSREKANSRRRRKRGESSERKPALQEPSCKRRTPPPPAES